jgi:hypothetical protein
MLRLGQKCYDWEVTCYAWEVQKTIDSIDLLRLGSLFSEGSGGEGSMSLKVPHHSTLNRLRNLLFSKLLYRPTKSLSR